MDLHFGQCTTAVPSGSVKSSRSARSFEKCPQLVHSINSSSCNISHFIVMLHYPKFFCCSLYSFKVIFSNSSRISRIFFALVPSSPIWILIAVLIFCFLMFSITYHFHLRIPTRPAISTFAALLRGWTGCILQDYHWGIRPAVVTLPDHRRRESDN